MKKCYIKCFWRYDETFSYVKNISVQNFDFERKCLGTILFFSATDHKF